MNDVENAPTQIDKGVGETGGRWSMLPLGWLAEIVKRANLTLWKVVGIVIAAALLFLVFYCLSKGVVDDDTEIVVTSSLADDAPADSNGTTQKQETSE